MAKKKVSKKSKTAGKRKPATAAKKKAAKKSPKKKSTKKAAANEMLLVASKTKEALKATGCNVASDALEGLNYVVHFYLNQAAQRAEANGRKTVRAHDFLVA